MAGSAYVAMQRAALAVLMMAVVTAASSPPSAMAPTSPPDLDYYMHVINAAPYSGVLVQALNSSYTASFGDLKAYTFNVTKGSSNSSQLFGYMRGSILQLSATSESHELQVEVLSYDDGAGTNGTISLQGLVNHSVNELAVVGGTGSFRGVRGYVVINRINVNLHHHSVYFLP